MKATRGPIPRPIGDRLQEKLVEQPNGCIEFVGTRLSSGYGRIWDVGMQRQDLAHRAAWTLAHGPIPEGLFVCHRCDNPPCCNVEHLFLGSQTENLADMAAKGRGRKAMKRAHCRNGHEFTPENTYIQPPEIRVCKICRRARARASDAKRRERRRAASVEV